MVGQDKHAPLRLDCEAVEANLTAYLKGGLAPSATEALREHLLHCDGCTQAVQEARALDARLYAEAPRRLYDVPPHFSEQVQEDVYRRMRRALVLQRTRAFTSRVATVIVSVLFLVTLAIMMGPWLRYLATVEATPTPANVARQERAIPTPVATTVPAAPMVVAPTPSLAERRASALPTERQSPADGARDLLEAAIGGDKPRVRTLLVGTRSRAPRVWARLEACQGAIAADDLHYRTIRYRTRFAGVRVHYGDHFAGEMKLLLREDGYWYLHYLNYSSFSILGHGCLAVP